MQKWKGVEAYQDARLITVDRDHRDVEHSIGILRTLFIQAANDPQDGRTQSLKVSRQMPPVHSNPVA